MSKISRRSFLKLLPALPFAKVAWPYAASAVEQWQQTEQKPNILVLVFDTLSARHLWLANYHRDTTPNLARFAERATVFHNHQAAANFTSSATSSIFTGTYPWSHRAFHLHDVVDESFVQKNIFHLLPDDYYKVAYTHNLLVTSLLHQFRGDLDLFKMTRDLCLADEEFSDRLFFEDYSVSFWAEWLNMRGGATPPASLFLSMADRVGRFRTKSELIAEYGELFPRGIPSLHSLFFILEDAINWIQEEVKTVPSPFFSYFHLLPPHEPYTTRKDFVDIFADGWQPIEKPAHFSTEGHPQAFLNRQRREYDEYLAYTDSEFGRLYDSLEQSGVLDNTYLIVTSDHGEMFERGIRGHVTLTLYEPLVHIPLIISKPGQRERVDVFDRTSEVDLMPTFLQMTGQPIPEWCEGRVLPTFGESGAENGRNIFSVEAKSNPKQAALTKATVAMVKDDYKLINYFGYKPGESTFELYNLKDDPEELQDLYTSNKSIADELQNELANKLEEVNQPYSRPS